MGQIKRPNRERQPNLRDRNRAGNSLITRLDKGGIFPSVPFSTIACELNFDLDFDSSPT